MNVDIRQWAIKASAFDSLAFTPEGPRHIRGHSSHKYIKFDQLDFENELGACIVNVVNIMACLCSKKKSLKNQTNKYPIIVAVPP